MHSQFSKANWGENFTKKLTVMVKNRVKNFILPFSICFIMALALYPDSRLDPKKYSTAGLELDYNIEDELAMSSQMNEFENDQTVFTPYLGKSFEGFKEALAFKESRGNYFTVNTLGVFRKISIW